MMRLILSATLPALFAVVVSMFSMPADDSRAPKIDVVPNPFVEAREAEEVAQGMTKQEMLVAMQTDQLQQLATQLDAIEDRLDDSEAKTKKLFGSYVAAPADGAACVCECDCPSSEEIRKIVREELARRTLASSSGTQSGGSTGTASYASQPVASGGSTGVAAYAAPPVQYYAPASDPAPQYKTVRRGLFGLRTSVVPADGNRYYVNANGCTVDRQTGRVISCPSR